MSEVQRFVIKECMKDDMITAALKKAKGDIVKEFEKMSPTDRAFERVVKDMHDIFDLLRKDIEKMII